MATYFLDFGPLFLPVLITLMVIKFLTVVAYFMHLKFDAPILRKAFYAGLILGAVRISGRVEHVPLSGAVRPDTRGYRHRS